MRRPLVIGLIALGTASCAGSPEPAGPGNPGVGPPAGPPSSVAISVRDFSFSPMSTTLKVGGSITWTNRGAVSHTVTGSGINSGQLTPPAGGGYGGGTGGGTYQRTFASAGTYSYACANHAQMTGTVTVVP